MKKILITSLLITVSFWCIAQDFKNSDLQSMVNTEKAFAQMAKEQNRRDAFLFYLTDDAITSGPGGIIKGKEHLRKQEIKQNLLSWEIAFTDIAASGDFGYTTGPWEFRRNKTDEKAIAFGEFNSIWKKQADGQWKNALDIGTSHDQQTPHETATTAHMKSLPAKAGAEATLQMLLGEEKKFIAQAVENPAAAYHRQLSADARLCHSGNLPILSAEAKQKFLETIPATKFDLIDGGIASSGDLGYVYGTAEVPVISNGKTEMQKGVYARFWKKETSGWKIVVDVLAY